MPNSSPMSPSVSSSESNPETIYDATLYQWLFFVRGIHDSQARQIELLHVFQAALDMARVHLGPTTAEFALPSLLPPWPPIGQRLANVPYFERVEEEETTWWELEARTLADTFYIQLAQAQPEEGAIEQLAARERWKGVTDDKLTFGEAVCYCAQHKDELTKQEVAELAAKIACEISNSTASLNAGSQAEIPVGVWLPGGYFMSVPGAVVETWVFLCSRSQNQAVSRFLHFVLPQLMLNRVKANSIEQKYPELQGKIQTEERQLRTELMKAMAPNLTLEKLEKLNTDVLERQVAMVTTLGELEKQVETVRIGAQNIGRNLDGLDAIARKLSDDQWEDRRPLVERQLTQLLHAFVEQAEIELRYAHIAQQQANIVMQSLNTTVGVRNAEAERQRAKAEWRLSWLLSAFAVMSLPQVFPQPPSFGTAAVTEYVWRLLLIGISVVGIYSFLRWSEWRDKRSTGV